MNDALGNLFEGGLAIRRARPSDEPFLTSLYRESRDDLRLLDADDEFIDGLIDWQYECQRTGYGEMFPNALYFVIEVQGSKAGRLVVDFGTNEVRVVDLCLISAARGRGVGRALLQGLQRAAAKVRAPLLLTVARGNPVARMLYVSLGFQSIEVSAGFERMGWFPGSPSV
ncbi:MAG: GNAT family N-acetyltransferase [Halothiobacillaceae bacterium]|jgi:ribosomal protein S18 acetylase RimI-like enzyme|nr:GNAT family N-acetyltransferase [Halothiobacillaceae bacterium]